ncbi:hypothetical protein LTR94_024382 [Friedmanniomyces endolithicus]|nr:hypothetical protein LTR94_024382 [Friedmanniomyces endolithicus]
MQVYVAVVTEGSFTGAARRLTTDKARVSRIVQRIEDRFGARLLNRSSRRLSVTDVGREYFENASSILRAVEAAEAAVALQTQEPRGRLKVTATAEFGTTRVDGWIAAYLSRWPKVTVETLYATRFVDIIGEGVDVAIRIGALQDSDLSARRLGEITYGLYASPAYLAAREAPGHMDGIGGHDLIMKAAGGRPSWTLISAGTTTKVSETPRCTVDNVLAGRNLALSGLGIALLPRFLAEPDVSRGALAPVLPAWSAHPAPVHAVFSSTRYMDPKPGRGMGVGSSAQIVVPTSNGGLLPGAAAASHFGSYFRVAPPWSTGERRRRELRQTVGGTRPLPGKTKTLTQTIGIIGTGLVGKAVARLAVAAGYAVVLTNSRGPDGLSNFIEELGPLARAGTLEETITAGDLVTLSIPLAASEQLPADKFAGKVVLDQTNYYPAFGAHDRLDSGALTSSELVQQRLPGAKVVKGLHNLSWLHMKANATPKGSPNRTTLPIAGDDAGAKQAVTEFFDKVGFDTIDAGSLADSWRIEPSTPIYFWRYAPTVDLKATGEDAERAYTQPGTPVSHADARRLIDEAKRPSPIGGTFEGMPQVHVDLFMAQASANTVKQ